MVLTNKQEEGLKIAVSRYNHGELWTCIAGYAGTGKSTLVQFIISALGFAPDEVAYITFTGKAAMVLRDKGCPNAQTSHRLLYKCFRKPDGQFCFIPRDVLDRDYKLIVVDEVSMLPKNIWELLLSHGIYIIALGDPFQLPPIGEDNGILNEPHVFLDEVMRQAQESEILRLSMDVRQGKPLELYKGTNLQIINPIQVVDGMFDWADQILVAKNATRRDFNQQIRQRKFGIDIRDTAPIEGDKLICLHNNWEIVNGAEDACINGTIGTISNLREGARSKWLNPPFTVDFISDDYADEVNKSPYYFRNLSIDYKLLTTGIPTVTRENFRKFPKSLQPLEFDYGYCITCWKAQGSEYDKVLLFEENFPRAGIDHQKYLYTGITRASDKLVIVKDY